MKNLTTDNTDDTDQHGRPKIGKARTYRGLTRMNADQKRIFTTEARRHGEDRVIARDLAIG